MRVMLTSCGLETKKIEESFLEFLGKVPEQADALLFPQLLLTLMPLKCFQSA